MRNTRDNAEDKLVLNRAFNSAAGNVLSDKPTKFDPLKAYAIAS
jgi:hypothetical protein